MYNLVGIDGLSPTTPQARVALVYRKLTCGVWYYHHVFRVFPHWRRGNCTFDIASISVYFYRADDTIAALPFRIGWMGIGSAHTSVWGACRPINGLYNPTRITGGGGRGYRYFHRV